MSYMVMCRVSGGVTGTREAALKADGEVRYFGTHAEAQAVATKLMAQTMGNPYRTADFSYWVIASENPEACPGCGCVPGDGVTLGCGHPDGCGYNG